MEGDSQDQLPRRSVKGEFLRGNRRRSERTGSQTGRRSRRKAREKRGEHEEGAEATVEVLAIGALAWGPRATLRVSSLLEASLPI